MYRWIWQHPTFPDFKFDKKLIDGCIYDIDLNRKQVEGMLSMLSESNRDKLTIETLSSEVLSSSIIEGEILDRESVRDSIRKRLDITMQLDRDCSNKQTDSLASVLLDSYFNFEELTISRLHNWNIATLEKKASFLQNIEPGVFRSYDDMVVSSGPIGREKIEYLALPAEKIDKNITALLALCNEGKEHAYIKAAKAHLLFVAIHPYDDGNGRVARNISNYIMAKEIGEQYRYYSLSSAMEHDRKGYYDALTKSTDLSLNKNFDFTPWLEWNMQKINFSILRAKEEIEKIAFKTKFWDYAKHHPLNKRQIKVISKLLESGADGFRGGLSSKNYISMTDTSKATASRDIQELIQYGILKQIEGTQGKSTRYEIEKDIDKENITLSIEGYREKIYK